MSDFKTTIDRVHSAIEILEELKRVSAERGYDWTRRFGNTYVDTAINYLRKKK